MHYQVQITLQVFFIAIFVEHLKCLWPIFNIAPLAEIADAYVEWWIFMVSFEKLKIKKENMITLAKEWNNENTLKHSRVDNAPDKHHTQKQNDKLKNCFSFRNSFKKFKKVVLITQ